MHELPSESASWVRLCPLHDLPTDGTGQAFEVQGRFVAVFRTGDGVHALDDTCPHAGASLSLGILSGEEVTCPAHALHFNLCSGRATDGAGERVRVWSTRLSADGWLEVQSSPG